MASVCRSFVSWVLKFNAHGPDGLKSTAKAPGQPAAAQRRQSIGRRWLRSSRAGRVPAIHGVVRWRIVDLCQWIFEESPGRRRPADAEPGAAQKWVIASFSARPRHHAQAEGRSRGFYKSFSTRLEEIGREKGVDPGAIEVWFADEVRVGQKNKNHPPLGQARRRSPARRKIRRTASAYIFGAICPRDGKGAALSSCCGATPRR